MSYENEEYNINYEISVNVNFFPRCDKYPSPPLENSPSYVTGRSNQYGMSNVQ